MRGIGLVLDQELKAIRPFSGFPVRGFAGSPYTVANLELFLYSGLNMTETTGKIKSLQTHKALNVLHRILEGLLAEPLGVLHNDATWYK